MARTFCRNPRLAIFEGRYQKRGLPHEKPLSFFRRSSMAYASPARRLGIKISDRTKGPSGVSLHPRFGSCPAKPHLRYGQTIVNTCQRSNPRRIVDCHKSQNSNISLKKLRKMVRAVGVEPTRAYAQQILSLVCLPFHHARNWRCFQIRLPKPCGPKNDSFLQRLVAYSVCWAGPRK